MNKLCCFYSFGTILMLIGAAGIVILGGVFKPFILEPKIDQGVKDGLQISYSTYNEADREKFRLDMKDYDFYYFNITNFAQVNGHVFDGSATAPPTPNVSEAGPYTYRYYEYKEDIEVIQAPTGEELIRYRIWWFYNPVAGNNELTDKICTINPIYMGGLNGAWQQSYYTAAPFAADEISIERQFFALLVPQIGKAVVPGAISQMVPQMGVGLFTVYIQGVVGALLTTFSQDIDTIMSDWRTKTSATGFATTLSYPPFAGFELGNFPAAGNPYVPGTTVTGRLFSGSAAFSLRTSAGWGQWVGLLTLYSKGITTGAAWDNFGTTVGPDIVTDLVLSGAYNVTTATAALSTFVPALFGRIATYVQGLATVIPATNNSASAYTAIVFNTVAVAYPPAGSFVTWEDFAYDQLAVSSFSNLVGLGNFVTIPASIVTPVTSPIASLIYGADPNIRFYGLELKSYNLGAPTRQQMKSFWADWINNGTKLYAAALGIGMYPVRTNPLLAQELGVLAYFNSFGFNFNLTDPTTSRHQALVFIDYMGSILTTFAFPQINAANSGLFTCRTPHQLTKGYTDVGLGGIPFPGWFNDQNVNYTGAFRTLFTGKDNADIARFYYARNNVTTFRTLADLGRFTECPINLATGLPVCHDIWSGPNYDNNGITVSIKDSSTFSFFGPFQEGKTPRPLAAFNNDLLRTVNLTYEVDEDVKGITTRRYKLADEMLQKLDDNPANTVFRMTKKGVAPMKFAVPLWGFTLSRPHFVDAEDSIISSVNGLDRNNNYKYQTNVWVEPLTGAVMQGTKKLQGSFHLRAYTFDERLYGRLFAGAAGEYYWPTFWANERGVLNDSQADDFKSSIYYYRDLANLLQPIGYGVGAGLFAIGLVLMVLGCKAKSAAGATQLKSSTTL